MIGIQNYRSDMIILTWDKRKWFDDIEFTWLYEDAQRWSFMDFQIPYEFSLLRWAY
jgi:hypothetical protein